MWLVIIWKKIFIILKENHLSNKVVHSIFMFFQQLGGGECNILNILSQFL